MSNGETARGAFGTLWWGFLLGASFHVGWAVVGLVLTLLANAVGRDQLFLK